MRAASRFVRSPSIALFVALAAAVTLPASRAAAQDFDDDLPLDTFVLQHPCTGELVVLEGHMHFHSTTSPDGTVQVHVDMQGVSATTVPLFPGEQPRKYVCSETQNQTTKFGEDNATQHLRWQFNFIRTGEDGGIACCGDDFYLHVNMQIDLFDAVAVPTLEDIDGECK